MGEVYLAEDLTLDRRVALKVLSPAVARIRLASNASSVKRRPWRR
jgi:serine/threonine protein kinase